MVDGTPFTNGAATRHSRVISRFEELLEANGDWPLHLAKISEATGVSDRTLRICCHEHLGMGPIRYMWLRRMHLARSALVSADRATATVTEIATHFGFCELGRFSVEYRALFGELPSVSLRRPSHRCVGPSAAVDCAARPTAAIGPGTNRSLTFGTLRDLLPSGRAERRPIGTGGCAVGGCAVGRCIR
jgi:AraC-like DNA-binding protein